MRRRLLLDLGEYQCPIVKRENRRHQCAQTVQYKAKYTRRKPCALQPARQRDELDQRETIGEACDEQLVKQHDGWTDYGETQRTQGNLEPTLFARR
ncbi:hypothetical protein HRbin15_01893 [bacterium HR15]|nr:hypothetical protein HRbin15_01893 [bacterium HR15]